MQNNMELESFKRLCAEHGLKCTPQRFAVYLFMLHNTTHPSVDEIWENVKAHIHSITRESVFRILNELAALGVVYRMDKIINARFDGVPENHGHLICDCCGAVVDFKLPDNMPVPRAGNGFRTDHVELRLSGLCAKCAAELDGKKEK